jgi:hypothetical protein
MVFTIRSGLSSRLARRRISSTPSASKKVLMEPSSARKSSAWQ